LLEKSFEILFWKKVSGPSNAFIISKRQSSLSNKFYNQNQTLQAVATSNIVRIGRRALQALYQFFIVIN